MTDAPVAAHSISPVVPSDRIEAVDVLRGFSLLGILLMNIVSFGLPFAAYSNPSVYGGAEGPNLGFWLTNQVLFEGKMRAIFSMLFGASVIILTSRAEQKGAGVDIADVYYRRTLWLIAFGVLHGYLIWYGDILFHYGVVGLALFPFRKLSAKSLVIIGAAILGIHSLQGIGGMFHFREVQKTVAAAEAAKAAGKTLTEEQTAAMDEWKQTRSIFQPEVKNVEKEIKTHRSGYLANLGARAGTTSEMQSTLFYRFFLFDAAGMLVLGMGMMKIGAFDASRSYRFYTWMIVLGYGIGIPLNWAMAHLWMASGFDLAAMFGYLMASSDPGRFSVAAGHIGVLMCICKSGALPWVRRSLANVGRTALSNYLLTSVLCTLFFNGYGLGFFGKLQRYQLLYVMGVVWIICLISSAIWLRYFRFGPAEWLWRSLTYWKKQPMRLVSETPVREQALPASI